MKASSLATFEVPAIAAAVLAIVAGLWALRGEPGMTWDEPYFFERSQAVASWLDSAVATPGGWSQAFAPKPLAHGWPFCREVPNQHPPVPSLLGLATERLLGRWVGPLRSYRLATVAVFALGAGALFRFLRRRWGFWPAALALGMLVSDPRPFIHAQLLTADSDLGVFWLLAAMAQLRSCETGRGYWRFGVWAGLAFMCKATGVLLFVAAVAWAVFDRPRHAWKPLFWSALTTPATVIALNPGWWPNPVVGLLRWVGAFLAYPQKVPVAYLGQVYDSMTTFLPWHNSAVLTATMVPLGLLILGALGLLATIGLHMRRQVSPTDPTRLPERVVAGWAALNFLTFPVLRAFPFLPAHDGLRQMVAAYDFLPILGALGVFHVLRLSAGRRVPFALSRLAVAACVATAFWETARIHPFAMSYYNPLIGGPRGAQAAGMETTYFWDSATQDVLDWMNQNLPREATVLIFPPPNVLTFGWEQRWGRLRPDLNVLNLEGREFGPRLGLMHGRRPCYLIFQNRQGLYLPRNRAASDLFARLAVAPALYELAPARVDGVRLLAIFDRENFRAVEGEGNR